MIKKVAYLAPEIPSVSATFVCEEILNIQARGIQVIPISLYRRYLIKPNSKLQTLLGQTLVLYNQSFFKIIQSNIYIFCRYPKKYLYTFKLAILDLLKLGLFKLDSVKIIYRFFHASIVAQTVIEKECQHLHAHFATAPALISSYAALLAGVNFTFTAHAVDIFAENILLKEKCERAKAVVTISQYNREFLIQRGIDDKKIKIIRCGVNTHKHKFSPKTHFPEVPKIVTLGRLIEKKGIDTLIIALSQLKEKGVNFLLEIGGEGSQKDYLANLIAEHGLESISKFKGAIPSYEVPAWLREADIFVLACKQDNKGDKDGIPIVLMEAMAIGLPVISTNISGIPELIDNNNSGILVAPEDPTMLASAIYKLLTNEQLLQNLCMLARKKVVSEFDCELNLEELLKIINDVIS